MSGATTTPRNPWMVALTVMWSLLLLLGLILLLAGAGAQGLPEDTSGGYTAAGGVLCALSVLVIGVQLGAGAVRWYLDPSSRTIAPADSDRPRPARQDF